MTKIKEIMTSRNIKTVLFVSLIATMILPFSIMDFAKQYQMRMQIKTPKNIPKHKLSKKLTKEFLI